MDRSTLADELRAARFRTTQFRTGYDEGAVDDLIDMLVGQLGTGVADHEILATVRTSRFPTTKARRGYEMGDVDALLARVTSAFGGEPMPASTGGSTGSGAALPSAVIEPPRGFLARLRGR
jgi:DivIVA domain-containing protein